MLVVLRDVQEDLQLLGRFRVSLRGFGHKPRGLRGQEAPGSEPLYEVSVHINVNGDEQQAQTDAK